jgi:xanthine dehydrogenase YagT iron-sulfur-binding subunit
MLGEFRKGMPSAVTVDGNGGMKLSDEEIKERMSGNLCRCGAYVGITEAIQDAFQAEEKR